MSSQTQLTMMMLSFITIVMTAAAFTTPTPTIQQSPKFNKLVTTTTTTSSSIRPYLVHVYDYPPYYQQQQRSSPSYSSLKLISSLLRYKTNENDDVVVDHVKVDVDVVNVDDTPKRTTPSSATATAMTTSTTTATTTATTDTATLIKPKTKKSPRVIRRSSSMDNVVEIETLHDFRECMKEHHEKELIVVRFYATFCKTCKKIEPFFFRYARRNPNIFFINIPYTRENGDLHQTLNVSSVPFGHIYSSSQLVEEVKMNDWALFERTLTGYANALKK